MSEGNTWVNVLVGAAITLEFSFTGFSPLLGGGVAGYLEARSPKRGAIVGAFSGVIVTFPLLLITIAGIGLFVAVPVSGMGIPMGGLEVFIILVMIVPIFFLWFVGLSAVGGYLGVHSSRTLSGGDATHLLNRVSRYHQMRTPGYDLTRFLLFLLEVLCR